MNTWSQKTALTLDAWKGEFHLTVFRTLGTLRRMSASRRRPLPHFQPGKAAIPAWHDRDVGLHWGVASGLGGLRVSACEPISIRLPQSCQDIGHPPNTEGSVTTSLLSGTWGRGADAVAVVCLLALV